MLAASAVLAASSHSLTCVLLPLSHLTSSLWVSHVVVLVFVPMQPNPSGLWSLRVSSFTALNAQNCYASSTPVASSIASLCACLIP